MRYYATRTLVRRMQAIDRALRAGQWPTSKSLAWELKEEEVIEAALKQLRDQEGEVGKTGPALDDFIDHDFVEYCAREADDSVTLEEVLEATSTITESMARSIIEDERADRF
jgi:hypothetical protein